VTAFFIPGILDDAPILEDAYRDLRARIEPFVVCWQDELGSRQAAREIVGCNAYSVLEFDA
jgi:hypothetical protein